MGKIEPIYAFGWVAVAGKYITDEIKRVNEIQRTRQEKMTFNDYSYSTFTGLVFGFIPATVWPITAVAYVSSQMRDFKLNEK